METDFNKTEDDELIKRLYLVKNDPWEFSKYVYTLDEQDRDNPVKRFPYEEDYIKYFIRIWQKYNLLLVPKSRRMKASWTSLMLQLWLTMFHRGVHTAITSKKEEDADFLLKERIKFMYENLDSKALPREFLPPMQYKEGLITFPTIHSKLQGFPQASDAMRQFTLSSIFADEFAFWPKAAETYKAAKPTLEGGGRFLGISSAAPGFMRQLVFDMEKVDSKRQPPKDVKRPMEGIQLWQNPKNKFWVFRLHYRADPLKRTNEWKEGAKAGVPIKDWNQEYEIQWDVYEGTPVYEDFVESIHGYQGRFRPKVGIPILRGWDFGLTPACICAQLYEEILDVFMEYCELNMGLIRFMEKVKTDFNPQYPYWANTPGMLYDFIDPAGFNRHDDDEKSNAEYMAEQGLEVMGGAISWEERRTEMEKWLVKFRKGKACFRISIDHCPRLVEGFKGGYRYSEKDMYKDLNKIRPEKNAFSHPHDGLQYIATGIDRLIESFVNEIPDMAYSFTGR